MLGSLRKWEQLPEELKTEVVRPYYEQLEKKKISLCLKRIFDFTLALIILIIISPVLLILSIAIVRDSKGGIFFRQERVTQYGRKFRIFKFRTMVEDAEKLGSQVTVSNDMRVTKVGKIIRRYRLDELPQLLNVIVGDMSFVGTRPEITKYVEKYNSEMMATLLLPAGITSEASIRFKNEEKLLNNTCDIDKVYVEDILPQKMKYNLKVIRKFSFLSEIRTMLRTVLAVLGKEYK